MQAVDLDELIQRIEDPAANDGVLREGYDEFIARMDAYDAGAATRLARVMHERAGAVWSAFCLEGALRRGAPAGAGRPESVEAFKEADAVLGRLIEAVGISVGERIALVQRRAILCAGFGRRAQERLELGRALGAHGVDGAQILGFAALVSGDDETSAKLFASLLDRAYSEAEGGPDAAPWALRGHTLAVYEGLLVPR